MKLYRTPNSFQKKYSLTPLNIVSPTQRTTISANHTVVQWLRIPGRKSRRANEAAQ